MTKEKGVLTITGLVDGGGSKYHSVELPLKALHGKIVKIGEEDYKINSIIINKGLGTSFFSEDEIKSSDLLFYNWVITNTEGVFSIHTNKYNTSTLMSVDDLWILPEQHIEKKLENPGKIIRQLANSDFVLASTDRLKEHVRQYNPFVLTSYNDLPLGKGQFIVTEKKGGEKLRIGVIASISHYMDWIQLKQVVNKLSKNENIAKNCVFVIVGYKKSRYWEEIVKLFKIKKNLEVEIVEGKSVEEYMSLYEKLDICLMPLLDCEFNKNKSFLKLRECAIKGVVPIGSKIYSEKDGNVGILIAETPKDYEKWIEYLLKEGNLEEMSKKISETNLKTNDFEKRVEDLRKVIEFIFTKEFKEERNKVPKGLKIYGITYNNDQYTEYEQYDNSHIRTFEQKSWRYEYNPIIDVIDNKIKNEEYLGVFSYKMPIKTGLSSKLLYGIFEEIREGNYDLISFSPSYWKSGKEFMLFSEKEHVGLTNIIKLCMNNIGKEYKDNPKNIIYSNFFIMKTELWKEYLNEWIKPSLDYMENEIWEVVNQDAGYKSFDSTTKGGLNAEKLKEFTGMEFYNFVTFALERMASQFCEYKRLKVIDIL